MRSIAGYKGRPTTRVALMLLAYLFQRPGNIRQMEWMYESPFDALGTTTTR